MVVLQLQSISVQWAHVVQLLTESEKGLEKRAEESQRSGKQFKRRVVYDK